MKILGKEIEYTEYESSSRVDGTMGRSDSKLGKIHVCRELTGDNKQEVILHETIHLICEFLAIELTEQQVTALSSAIFCVSKENNWLKKIEVKK